MRRIFIIPIVAAMVISACIPSEEPPAMTPPSPSSSNASPESLSAQLGRVIIVDGVAQDAKLGALLLLGGSRTVWIDGLDAWPANVRGKLVRVTGKVIERSDLPVFVPREGAPAMQGIPVPAGTDVEKASRRLLLAEAKWQVLE